MKKLTARQIIRRTTKAKRILVDLGFVDAGDDRFIIDVDEPHRNNKGQQIIAHLQSNSWKVKVWDKDNPRDCATAENGTCSFRSEFGGIERLFEIISKQLVVFRVSRSTRELKESVNNALNHVKSIVSP